MSDPPVDTNVIVRYLVEDPDEIESKFAGVYGFFDRIAEGQLRVYLPDLVLFQAYFVLTSYYEVPASEAAEKLGQLIQLPGVHMADKSVIRSCLERLRHRKTDIVDSYLVSWAEANDIPAVYSFDEGLKQQGLKVLTVE